MTASSFNNPNQAGTNKNDLGVQKKKDHCLIFKYVCKDESLCMTAHICKGLQCLYKNKSEVAGIIVVVVQGSRISDCYFT